MTKAGMLRYLSSSLKLSKIDDFISFTVEDWNRDFESVISKIQKSNLGNTLIVRSSAIQEDNINWTYAGAYKSVLGVPGNNTESLVSAINKVIDSFRYRGNLDPLNEIIVQRQLLNPRLSGVVFTRDPKTCSPYYTIEYDDYSGQTNLVTGTGERKLIRIARFASSKVMSPWSVILPAVQEIETLISKKMLDIELALDRHNTVHIFQVRTLQKMNNVEEKDKLIGSLLKELSLSFINTACRESTIYSDMADWNPAEMLGSRPSKLAVSLYRFLITKDTWRRARTSLGYTDLAPRELMVIFAGKPYIDVDASLRSLTPSSLPDDIRNRLVQYQMDKLRKKPYLHDKIEFTVAYSCADVVVPRRTSLLRQYSFSNQEVMQIDGSLVTLTQTLLTSIPDIVRESQLSLNQLSSERTKWMEQIHWRSSESLNDLLLAIEKLLSSCKELGVYPFARLARLAFIGHDLLQQLLQSKAITIKQYQSFLSSIKTVPSLISEDLISIHKGIMSKKDFLKKYGHLRPGTYDITVPRYDQMPEMIFGRGCGDIPTYHLKPFQPNSEMLSNIEKVLEAADLEIDGEFFLKIVKDTIEWRDKAKVEFTRTLSDTIELLAKAGDLLDFTRTQLVHLEIEQILSNDNTRRDISEIRKSWYINIEENRRTKKLNDCVLLPSVIQSKNDFLIIQPGESKPNFVTCKTVEAPVVVLNEISSENIPNLGGRIVVVEAADPGYDWIFLQGIVGLVTKYGGVASHMAIRCSELDIPAAIGCSDIIYERLKKARVICINANEEKLLVIN
jgi:phosphohistidine swiveling domain-containing protein